MRLVATERHVEAALAVAGSSDARTVRSFLRRLGANHLEGFAPATPEVTLLATSTALDALPDTANLDTTLVAGALDRALGELRHAGADARALEAGGERGRVLALLLDATDARLSRARLFDDRAIGWVASYVIRALPADAIDPDTVVEGLGSFSGGDLAWIEALAERSRVVVRLPTFSVPEGLGSGDAAAFSQLASDATDAALSPLEARWHALDRAPDIEPVPAPLPHAFELVEARSDLVETRAVVRAVLRALDEGAEPERIAIIVPDLDEAFLEPLRAALDEAEIPFAEPRGRPPTACPVGAASLAWIDLAIGPVVRDDLVDLVRSRDIASRFWLGADLPADREPSVRQSRGRTNQLARTLASLAVGADADGSMLSATLAEACADDEGTAWMGACVDASLARLARLRNLETRRQIVAELRDTWTTMGLAPPGSREIGEAISLTGNMRHLSLAGLRDRAAALRSIATGLDRLDAAAQVLGLSDAPASLAKVRSELHLAIGGAAGGAGAARSSAVHIARAAEVAGLPHDLVIVTRASEGTFEGSLPSSSLLDENVLVGLPPNRRPPSRALSRASSRCILLRAMAASRSVVVSRATADTDGRIRAPSTVFAALARAHAPRVEPASRLFRHTTPLSLHESRLVRVATDDLDDTKDLRARVDAERERITFFREPSTQPGSRSGLIDPTVASDAHWASLIGGHTRERPLPATALERAAGCRFASFAARVLGATRSDDASEELDARMRGSLVHRALKIAMETVSSAAPSTPVEQLQALALDAVERVFLLGSPLRRAEIARALTFVLRVVRWSFEQDPHFSLWLAEQPFGVAVPEAWPALEIEVEGRPAYLSGRIDRLDRSFDGKAVRIIDYKTGAIPGPRDEPRLFQLPLYGRAVVARDGDGSRPEMTALYLGTSAGSAHATPANRQTLSDDRIDSKANDAARIIAALWLGDVAPRPMSDDVCSHCDARDICRRPVVMPIEPGDDEATS